MEKGKSRTEIRYFGGRMTDGFSLLGMKKVDRRMEVLEGRDSSFRFLGLSGRSVLVEFGGFPSVSRMLRHFRELLPCFFKKL